MLYLLHFDKPVSGKRHYLGATTEDRFKERLREHAGGHGSKLTARAVAQGARIYVARLFPQLSFRQEQQVKAASHFRNLCPLCCPLFSKFAEPLYELKCRPVDEPPDRAVWDWRPRPSAPHPLK